MRGNAVLGFVAAVAAAGVATADDNPAPIGPGDPTWAMRALAGYSRTGGNTDTTSANFLFHVAHVIEDWKLLFGAEGLYGSTAGETTAQAWDAHFQANYNLTPRLYWYSGLRYDDDRFSGFAYQETLKTGAGYQFIATDATKLTAQAGAGYSWLRPEILVKDDLGGIVSTTELGRESDVVFDGGLNFEHSFNEFTKLLASATTQAGSLNTMTVANVALQVKMGTRLSLAAGYQLTDNSKPPPGSVRRDTLATLSLVYELKNAKLPAE